MNTNYIKQKGDICMSDIPNLFDMQDDLSNVAEECSIIRQEKAPEVPKMTIAECQVECTGT